MAPVSGTTSSYAAALGGLRQAQLRVLDVAQHVAPPGGLAPVDSVEFSDAARSASAESIATDAVELSKAKTETSAMALLIKTQEKMDRQAIDLVA
jgi:hypothetical protein